MEEQKEKNYKHQKQIECLLAMVYMKDFFYSKDIQFLIKHYIPKLTHQNDGIIFTKNKWKYSKGKTNCILKAKPSSLNTIDFNIKLQFKPKWSNLSVFGLYADQASNQKYSGKQIQRSSGKIKEKFAILVPHDQQQQKNIMSMLFKKKEIIAECQYVDDNASNEQIRLLKDLRLIQIKEQFSLKSSSVEKYQQIIMKYDNLLINQICQEPNSSSNIFGDQKVIVNKYWKIMRFREDKQKANYITVAQNVFQCIKQDLKIEELISELANANQDQVDQNLIRYPPNE